MRGFHEENDSLPLSKTERGSEQTLTETHRNRENTHEQHAHGNHTHGKHTRKTHKKPNAENNAKNTRKMTDQTTANRFCHL